MSINNSRDFLRKLKKNPENFYIIHYSCQNLSDDNEGLSPRITSIAVAHYATEQVVSFSTHLIAEELSIEKEQVRDEFDKIEKRLLEKFYEFIRDRRDKFWVHWNMKNSTYGFEHLEHRYTSLGGKNAPIIPVEHRLNLNDLISDRYGSDYAAHPKMKSLMELNDGVHRNFLTGEDEVKAFQNGEFIRMHSSTLSKVEFFRWAIKKFSTGKLHTSSKGFGIMLDRVFEHRWTKITGALATLLMLIVALYQLYLWIA